MEGQIMRSIKSIELLSRCDIDELVAMQTPLDYHDLMTVTSYYHNLYAYDSNNTSDKYCRIVSSSYGFIRGSVRLDRIYRLTSSNKWQHAVFSLGCYDKHGTRMFFSKA